MRVEVNGVLEIEFEWLKKQKQLKGISHSATIRKLIQLEMKREEQKERRERLRGDK